MSMTALPETTVLMTLIEEMAWKVSDPRDRAEIYLPVYHAIRGADWEIDMDAVKDIDYVFDRIAAVYHPNLTVDDLWASTPDK